MVTHIHRMTHFLTYKCTFINDKGFTTYVLFPKSLIKKSKLKTGNIIALSITLPIISSYAILSNMMPFIPRLFAKSLWSCKNNGQIYVNFRFSFADLIQNFNLNWYTAFPLLWWQVDMVVMELSWNLCLMWGGNNEIYPMVTIHWLKQ